MTFPVHMNTRHCLVPALFIVRTIHLQHTLDFLKCVHWILCMLQSAPAQLNMCNIYAGTSFSCSVNMCSCCFSFKEMCPCTGRMYVLSLLYVNRATESQPQVYQGHYCLLLVAAPKDLRQWYKNLLFFFSPWMSASLCFFHSFKQCSVFTDSPLFLPSS